MRFLAIFAAGSASFFVCYNVPGQRIGLHADPWPQDVQERSYFTGAVCGDGTDPPAQTLELPDPTKHSGYIDSDGKLVSPDGAELPKVVPFQPGN